MNVLDLFAGLGGWSRPAKDRGHEVLTLDIDPRFEPDICADILEWDYRGSEGWADLILASPPCEAFSVAAIGKNWGGGFRAYEPTSDRARLGKAVLTRTVELIRALQPAFFVIENPVGMMRRMPDLTFIERRTVTYCQYGESYMKPTDLWGGFPPSLRLKPRCSPGDPCHEAAPRGAKTGIQGIKDPAERAVIPYELALAVIEAAERDLAAGAVSAPRQGGLFAGPP